MKWPTRAQRASEIDQALRVFSKTVQPLRGIADDEIREVLVWQMIASLRRLDYTRAIRSRHIDRERGDPNSVLFEPERGAAHFAREGERDEAIWLIFLATHFGQHGRHKWQMLRDVYSGLGAGVWTWKRISNDPPAFRDWLRENIRNIRGAFGNHRKYETLNPESPQGTASVIESFVQCCSPSPSNWFAVLARETGNDPGKIFDAAYDGLTIARFGRLAKFDFLALLGRLDLAPVSPSSAYLKGATGPLRGARLLVDGDPSSKSGARALDEVLQRLDETLNVGMQVMEDSICNWQKSPSKFVHFTG